MSFPLVEGSNAFFQLQKRSVNFGSISSSLFILIHVVSSSLVTCQINKRYLAESILFLFDTDLQNGVRARRVVICVILRSDSQSASLLDYV